MKIFKSDVGKKRNITFFLLQQMRIFEHLLEFATLMNPSCTLLLFNQKKKKKTKNEPVFEANVQINCIYFSKLIG